MGGIFFTSQLDRQALPAPYPPAFLSTKQKTHGLNLAQFTDTSTVW
ncbi:protein of unknown function [Xenorhabdus poinarii G6]|uniref:Uncharacterized protein n=1 Tax=Xenorhabdus poinarii G6 TaxID=1354304 RepID=A0A068R3G2_9GAMM|nr:protein of unknown function [Xenorhabdus poinarii G6]